MKTLTNQTKSILGGLVALTIAFFFITPKLFSNKPDSSNKKAPITLTVNNNVATDVFVIKRETITDEIQTWAWMPGTGCWFLIGAQSLISGQDPPV